MAEERIVSHPGEAKLRKAFSFLQSWTANGLAERLREEDIGLPSKNAANILIFDGYSSGLLLREGGAKGYVYRLNADWKRPGWSKPASGYVPSEDKPRVRKAVAPERVDLGPADNYAGPAFGHSPLLPHLGRRAVEGLDADGELLPCVGGAMVDYLGEQFYSACVR